MDANRDTASRPERRSRRSCSTNKARGAAPVLDLSVAWGLGCRAVSCGLPCVDRREVQARLRGAVAGRVRTEVTCEADSERLTVQVTDTPTRRSTREYSSPFTL